MLHQELMPKENRDPEREAFLSNLISCFIDVSTITINLKATVKKKKAQHLSSAHYLPVTPQGLAHFIFVSFL